MSEQLSFPQATRQPMLVVGSVAYDNIITPHSQGERILGGSASYASLAGSFFTPTRLVGVVGNDFDPGHIERLRKRGVDLTGLQTDDSGPTFFWKGQYHENFNRRDTLEIQLNVFERFNPVLPSDYRSSPYVMLGNIGPDLQLAVLDQMEQKPFVIADTIDLWIEIKQQELLELIKRVDLFIINDSEATLLTGETNIIRAGEKLRTMGPASAIIKKGEHGAYLFHADGLFALPAYPVVELNDPTGAGDSFAGAFLGYLAAIDRHDFAAMKQAMTYATVVASLTVEAFSCDRLESAGIAEIQSRRNALLAMIDAGASA